MDILDQLIQLAQIRGQADIHCRLQGDWSIPHEQKQGQANMHIISRGSGWLNIAGEKEARAIKQGDILFFPQAHTHRLSSSDKSLHRQEKIHSRKQGVFTLNYCGDYAQADMEFFCAVFHYEANAALFRALPQMIAINVEHPALQTLSRLLKNEADKHDEGAASLIHALSSALFIMIIRAYLADSPALPEGIIKAGREPRLQPLIHAIMHNPEQDWTIEKLCELGHLSRAQLMRLFRQHLNISPYAFILQTRLQKAAHLLKNSQDSILNIALLSGFNSETNFGKAFKNYYGISAGDYRKQ